MKVNWIERYIQAVGEHLPSNDRQDIESELRSLLLDTLEDRTGSPGPHDDDTVLAVLQEFGSPQETADRYAPRPRYIIGPPLYESYLQITGILIIMALIGQTVALVIQISRGDLAAMAAVGAAMGRALSTVAGIVGWTTIIFGAIQHFSRQEKPAEGDSKPWDPRELPDLHGEERIPRAESLFGIAISVAALVGANLLAFRLGIYGTAAPDPNLIFVNSEAVSRLLPWWNLIWAAGLVHETALLIKGRWNRVYRWQAIAIDVASIILLIVLFRSELIISEQFLALGGPEQAKSLADAGGIVPTALRGVFLGAMAFTLWDMFENVRSLIAMRP